MANGDTSACPGLAAAILSVCVIRSRSDPALARTSSIVIPAISEFFDNVLNRARASNTYSGTTSTGVSPPGSQGALPARPTARSAGANTATLSGADADAFYMGGALLHLALPHVPPGHSDAVEEVMLTVLGMLVRLLETPEHLEHLLSVSMALSLLGSALKSSRKLQDADIAQGVVGKVRAPSPCGTCYLWRALGTTRVATGDSACVSSPCALRSSHVPHVHCTSRAPRRLPLYTYLRSVHQPVVPQGLPHFRSVRSMPASPSAGCVCRQ